MAKAQPFRLEATYTPIAKRSCSRSHKNRPLGGRSACCLIVGGTIDDFYFGGVKMKKLGWGLGMSGWLISMFLILQIGCE